MRFAKGDIVVAGYTEMDEEYLARVERVDPRGTHINPIVRVLRVLRYPRQCAIMAPEQPHEVPPCRFRELCRLPVIRIASGADIDRYADYESSLRACAQQRLTASSPAQQAILARHLRGVIRGRRANLTYREYEIMD